MKSKSSTAMKSLMLMLLCAAMTWGGQLSAANPLLIKGTVSDQDNYPLAGAAIYIQGTSVGTMADEKGEFSISAEKGQVLIVSFIGFKDKAVNVTDQLTYFINLDPDTNFLEETVIVGYDTQKKVNLTGSVTWICWVPEKEYAPGSWGYVGGEAYRPKSGDSTLPAAEISILGTDSDPMYQTQRRGLEAFRADVPDGKYSVYLHWAELVRPGAEKLLYNLGRDSVYDGGSERIFSVSVNGTSIHEQLNVLEEVGPARPFVTKVDVTVEDGEGICVGFKPCDQGQTMLTAVRIVKLD